MLGGCQILDLPRMNDVRGNLSFIEAEHHVPFKIERVYYLYDVPGGESRGGHAHRALQQFVIAAAGSFDVVLKNGEAEETLTLNRPYQGLFIPQMVWRELNDFSSGAVCLVIASAPYDESDYLRDFDVYRQVLGSSSAT